MKAFGLTGNIGCGKSTVAKLLSQYPDVVILDCDGIAKEIISSSLHRKEISDILRTDVYTSGKVDFKAIAEIIFGNPKKKRLLENLLHPLVWTAVEEKVKAHGDRKICIVESAIIYETKCEDKFAAIIVAACNPEEQFRRLQDHRGMSCAEIQVRLAEQLASSEKEARAQCVIRTDCSLEELENRVNGLYHYIKLPKGAAL